MYFLPEEYSDYGKVIENYRRIFEYGYKINKRIQELTQNEYELKEATLYTAFRRLEEAGYICSYWGNENTGARRRYYTITPEGRNAYRKLCSEWEIAKGFIDVLIHSEPSNPKQV